MGEQVALWIAGGLAIAGAVWDIRYRRLPNWLALALGVAAIVATFLAGGWALLGSAAIHAVIVLVVGMALFALKAIGAGDAKFYSAAAFAVPLDRALPMLGWVSVSALVIVIAMTIWYRGLKVIEGGKRKSWTLPYGVPIGIGFIAVIQDRLLGSIM
ncbi:A24 family peptidase [Qipengyuania zhejiangensis]|uniref:A24 family peptidase n=1 Tax=Qipengyuania zhejiangensis TaxID=3077782 RepID=UPI002D79B25E|nr:prepilin peptidase [Qipengyuania sp. Z2]